MFKSRSLPAGALIKRYDANMELVGDERCDVSTISTSSVDSAGDIILPDGIDTSEFIKDGSPVYFDHTAVRVGRSLWTKKFGNAWRAKTKYEAKPSDWPAGTYHAGDVIWGFVRKGKLTGKSITVIPVETRAPDASESALGAKNVIVKCKLLEYSVTPDPANAEATVLAVSRSMGGERVDEELFAIEAYKQSRLKAAMEFVGKIDTDALIQRSLDGIRIR